MIADMIVVRMGVDVILHMMLHRWCCLDDMFSKKVGRTWCFVLTKWLPLLDKKKWDSQYLHCVFASGTPESSVWQPWILNWMQMDKWENQVPCEHLKEYTVAGFAGLSHQKHGPITYHSINHTEDVNYQLFCGMHRSEPQRQYDTWKVNQSSELKVCNISKSILMVCNDCV